MKFVQCVYIYWISFLMKSFIEAGKQWSGERKLTGHCIFSVWGSTRRVTMSLRYSCPHCLLCKTKTHTSRTAWVRKLASSWTCSLLLARLNASWRSERVSTVQVFCSWEQSGSISLYLDNFQCLYSPCKSSLERSNNTGVKIKIHIGFSWEKVVVEYGYKHVGLQVIFILLSCQRESW